ncbi:migration and invasion enhancer 1-like [Ochlerotatus camptorhynchus]|uniref:migration and invasion enhancer 1-like n=1 Tax=Ochlerotatus camptorhynchus TaxID=644619 RepID=UPI0031E3D08A
MEKGGDKSNQVRVDIEYCNICNSKPQCLELSHLIKERIPGAQVACKIGRRGSFEVQINDSLVHSKLNSLAFPDYEEVVTNVIAAKEGRPVAKVKEQPITDCVVQ